MSLDYPRDCLQIVVAADGSNDRTAEIVQTFARRGVELSYDERRRGKMAAINRAIPWARGEIVVFSDANNLYDSTSVRELVAPFSDPTVGAVSGAKVVESGDGALGESEQARYLRELVLAADADERIGSVTGRILRTGGELVDTTGLLLGRDRRPRERGYGAADTGQFGEAGYVFGVGGVAPLYRRAMREDVAVDLSGTVGALPLVPSAVRATFGALELPWTAATGSPPVPPARQRSCFLLAR